MNAMQMVFPVYVCLFVPVLLLVLLKDVLTFRWQSMIHKLRFPLYSLLAVTIALGMTVAVEFLQQFGNARMMPFPMTFLFCLVLIGMLVAVVIEFRGQGCEARLARPRQHAGPEKIEISPPAIQIKQDPQTPSSCHRRKWWLRRMPNRFRSISHRDFQATPMSGYYSNYDL